MIMCAGKNKNVIELVVGVFTVPQVLTVNA
jgi:hypothetical protein